MANTTIGNALSAYNNAAMRKVSDGADSDATEAGDTFSSMIKGVVNRTIDDNKKGEKESMKAIAGEADMRDVVMAVSNAEMALETVVAVRDKVVSAYQEIMRMSI